VAAIDSQSGGSLPGEEGLRIAAVEAGLINRAVGAADPVEVTVVHRHPDRIVLPIDDGLRVAAVQGGRVDRAIACIGPVNVAEDLP
jgi:hypothetical protein